MTKEEAIDVLKNAAWIGSDIAEKVYPAVEMAIEALDKQIPKKPYSYHVRFLGGDRMAYDCPSCKHCFTTMKHGKSDYRNRFCDICGQAIDWSEA